MNCECKNYEWLPRFYTAEHHPLCLKNEPPKTIEELTTRMESIFELGKEGDGAFAVTGEAFVKYGIGYRITNIAIGNSTDGKEEERAQRSLLRAFWDRFITMFDGQITGFKLYWRSKPILSREEKKEDDAIDFFLRARFIVSDKPEIKSAVPND